jgi:hypothetical protein
VARPIQYITPEEQKDYMKRNRAFKISWADHSPYMKQRDPRGVKKWVYLWGWLACERFYQRHIIQMAQELADKIVREAEALSADFARKTGDIS